MGFGEITLVCCWNSNLPVICIGKILVLGLVSPLTQGPSFLHINFPGWALQEREKE